MKTRKTEPKPTGRPPKQRGTTIPVSFDSMDQAAALLRVNTDVLKGAKRLGCKAFVSGRIYSLELIQFLLMQRQVASELPEGFSSWKEVGDMWRALTAEVDLKERKHEVMEIAEAKRQAAMACQHFDAELNRAELELPPSLAGTTSADAYKILHRFCDNLRKTTRDKFNGLAP